MEPNWFIAIPVDASGWFSSLVTAPHRLSTFHPEELHLTVAFLGGCGAEAAGAAWARAVALPHPDVSATLGGLAPMGKPRRPSAIAATLDQGHEAASAYVAEHRGGLLAAASARPDTRPPLPHVTIGRPPRKLPADERAQIVAWARAQPPIGAPIRLSGLALYTWAEDRSVRQFTVVDRTP